MKGSYQLDSFTENRDAEITRLHAQVDLFFEKEFEAYTSFGLVDGMKIIECGSGPGYLLKRILQQYPRCEGTALEIDPFLVEVLKKNSVVNDARLFNVVEASIYNTGQPDDCFDFAITRLVIEHLDDPRKALGEIYRILKPGGKLIVVSNDFAYHLVTFPVIPELDEMYAAYCKSRFAEGGNPLVGRQIPGLLKKEKYSGVKLQVVNVHNDLAGDKAILQAENVNISKSLVSEGYLKKETLDSLAAGWYNMLRHPDHVIYRQLFVCCGEKNPSAQVSITGSDDNYIKSHEIITADFTTTDEADREIMINHFLKNQVRRIMGAENLQISNDDKLNDIDIDSIGAAELSSIIMQSFDRKIGISDILQKLSIGDITALILRNDKPVVEKSNEDKSDKDQKEPELISEYSSVISEIQEQFWILHKLFPESPAYNIPSVLKLTGNIDIRALEYSISRLIKRHEVLRARFYEKDNVVWQHISAESQVEFKPEVKYSDEEFRGTVPDTVLNEIHRPFELTEWPLFRIMLMCYKNNISILTVVFHHIIVDLQSRISFSNEIAEFYNSYLTGKKPAELPPENRYSDYAYRLRSWLLTGEATEKINEWQREIAPATEVLKLPADFARPVVLNQQGRRKHFSFGAMSSGIRQAADLFSVNPFTILLAAYSTLLYRLVNQQTIIIGVPLTNRRNVDFTDTFGCFVNIVPLMYQFSDDLTCSELIRRTRQLLLNAHGKQEIPFLRLNKMARSINANSVFQAGFTMESPMQLSLIGIDARPLEIDKNGSQLDLFLTLWEDEDSIKGYLEYSNQLFSAVTVERFTEIYKKITGSILENPEMPVSEIDIVPENEMKLITDWNETDHYYPDKLCLHQVFERQVTKTPGLPAIIYGDSSITYSEFNCHVNRMANFLIGSGIATEDIVCVCMERSPELLIAIYAILKAGGAYLPVDPDYPVERMEMILSDADPGIILTNRKSEKNIPSEYSKILLDNIMTSPLCDDAGNPQTGVNSRNLAYVMYTSGSTGKPKGVMIEHHSVINKLEWMQYKHPLDESDTIMMKTTVTFDVSGWELFWWMFNGAKLTILPPGGEKDPHAIINETEARKVTTIIFVPSMFSAFLGYVKSNNLAFRLSSLKWIIQIGEALRPSVVNSFNELLTPEFNPLMVNTYGPTEATIAVSWYNCPKERNIEKIYIGKPVFNTRLLVLNSRNRIQPVGVPGELIITGVNLSRGYLNRPELNAERFITFGYPGNRKLKGYRTGDLVRWAEDGNIDFMGRLDTQVKIRGYRIELGDIESALNSFP